MDIDALRTLLAFVETGSFTRAAQQVCRTQSAVSMQMKKLESDIGSSIFVKEGRQLILSNAGMQLAGYAKQIVNLHDDAFKQLKTSAGLTVVRIGCPDDYVNAVLPQIAASLHQWVEHLDLQISCASTMELKKRLDNGELDLIVATRSPSSEEGYLLQSSKGVWVKSVGFNVQEHPTLPIAIFMRDCKFHQAAVEGLLKINREFKIIGCCGSLSALQSLVQSGLAIGAIAEVSKASSLEVIEDKALPDLPVIDIVLLHLNHGHNPINQKILMKLVNDFIPI